MPNPSTNADSTLVELLQTPSSCGFYRVEIFVRPDSLRIPETTQDGINPPTEKNSYFFSRKPDFTRSALHPALLGIAQKHEIERQTVSGTLDRTFMPGGYVRYKFRSVSGEQLIAIKKSIESLQKGLNPKT